MTMTAHFGTLYDARYLLWPSCSCCTVTEIQLGESLHPFKGAVNNSHRLNSQRFIDNSVLSHRHGAPRRHAPDSLHRERRRRPRRRSIFIVNPKYRQYALPSQFETSISSRCYIDVSSLNSFHQIRLDSVRSSSIRQYQYVL